MSVEGIAAIVIGAASGLRSATAAAFAARGAFVYGFDLPASIEKTLAIADVTYVGVDVSDAVQVQEAVDRAAANEHPLWVVVKLRGKWTNRSNASGTSRKDNASTTPVYYAAQKIPAIRDIL